jgi:hypothetical protein
MLTITPPLLFQIQDGHPDIWSVVVYSTSFRTYYYRSVSDVLPNCKYLI